MSYIGERRQEEKERRRSEILDAAEAVAREVGWDALTMDQVARRSRLSRALLYVYFNDKTDLMFGVCDRGLGILQQRFAEAIARHRRGLDQIEAMGRAYLAVSQEFPAHFDAMARFEAHSADTSAQQCSEAECLESGRRVHELMVTAIRNGIADGSIRPDVGEPLVVAISLWGFMFGIIQLAATKANVLGQSGITARQLMEQGLLMAGRSMAWTPPR